MRAFRLIYYFRPSSQLLQLHGVSRGFLISCQIIAFMEYTLSIENVLLLNIYIYSVNYEIIVSIIIWICNTKAFTMHNHISSTHIP